MNQPPSAPVAPKQPAVAPWLLILFIIVLLGGGGYLIWNYLGQQKTQPSETTETAAPEEAIETPTEPTTEPTDTTATADWKTYTNTNYGYSLKYPNNLGVSPASSDILLNLAPENGQGKWIFAVEIKGLDKTVDQLVSDKKTILEQYYNTVNVSDIVIGGQQAKKIVRSNPKSDTDIGDTIIFVKNNSNIYEISSDTSFDSLNNVLSTFQFTP